MEAQIDKPENELLAVLRRDPHETSMLIKVGIALPIAIIVWQLGATFVLPLLAVAPVTIALILAYGAVLIYLTSRLIRSYYRWQAEAAFNAGHLSGNPIDGEGHPLLLKDVIAALQEATPAGHQVVDGPFHEAYFLLRLQEEVLRARREGLKLSVVVIGRPRS